MNTRYAPPGSPIRQERWASYRTLADPLLADRVAQRIANRCDDDEERRLIIWLQKRSHCDGGLPDLTNRLAAMMANDECGKADLARLSTPRPMPRIVDDEVVPPLPAVPDIPGWANRCGHYDLPEFCLNPDSSISPTIRRWLVRMQAAEHDAARDSIAQTQVSSVIWSMLDRCLGLNRSSIIEGGAGTGKTETSKAWVESSGGVARFIATPPGNDMEQLLRVVGDAIGCACGVGYKTRQMDPRIRASLKPGLMLAFDNAHNLWPQGDSRQSTPKRMQWVLSLMETGVPCAFIVTPLWLKDAKPFIAGSEEFFKYMQGRVSGYFRLPELALDDFQRVARFHMGETALADVLARAAFSSRRGLAFIRDVVRELRGPDPGGGRTDFSADALKAALKAELASEDLFALAANPESSLAARKQKGSSTVAPRRPGQHGPSAGRLDGPLALSPESAPEEFQNRASSDAIFRPA